MSSESLMEHESKDLESGQGTTEYALILSFVALVVFGAAALFGVNLASYLSWIANMA